MPRAVLAEYAYSSKNPKSAYVHTYEYAYGSNTHTAGRSQVEESGPGACAPPVVLWPRFSVRSGPMCLGSAPGTLGRGKPISMGQAPRPVWHMYQGTWYMYLGLGGPKI